MIQIGDFVRSYSGNIIQIDEHRAKTMQHFPKLNAFSIGEMVSCCNGTGYIQNIYCGVYIYVVVRSAMVSSSFALHQYYSVKHFRFTPNISGKLPCPYAIKSSDNALRHILLVAIQNEKSHRIG